MGHIRPGSIVQRLKSRAQFQAVLAGSTVARTPHFALHQLVLSAEAPLAELFPVQTPWLGAMAPKRWARRAVTRNAIKRQIYAVTDEFEPQLLGLPVAAYVLRLRTAFDRKQFVSASSDALKLAVRTELQQLMTRLLGKGAAASCGPRGAAA